MLNFPMLPEAFRPQKPDNRICCDTQDASNFLVLGPREKLCRARWLKAPGSMGKLSIAEVLRLRATSAVSRDKSASRSAQDDDLVGG
jgi:hypothetical protein